MSIYNSLELLVIELLDDANYEYLLAQRNIILYQSLSGRVRLSLYSTLGKSISRIVTNLKLVPPQSDIEYYYLDNPNNFMGERPISIVDAVFRVSISKDSQLHLSIIDLCDPKRLYKYADLRH